MLRNIRADDQSFVTERNKNDHTPFPQALRNFWIAPSIKLIRKYDPQKKLATSAAREENQRKNEKEKHKTRCS